MDVFAQYGDVFGQVIAGGFDRIQPIARHLAIGMTIISFGILTFTSMFRPGLVGAALMMMVASVFYTFVIDHAGPISSGIMESSVKFGLLAGNSSMSADAFLRSPDSIFYLGFSKAVDLYDLAARACDNAYVGCLGYIGVWLPVEIAAYAVWLTFAGAALIVFGLSVIFELVVLAGMILMSMAIFNPTAQFGWGPIRAVTHLSTQLMMMAILVSVNSMVFTKLTIGSDPGVAAVNSILLGTFIFAGTIIGAIAITAVLTSGALAAGGALLGTAAGMAMSFARSGAGHLDAPATAAARIGARGAAVGAVAGWDRVSALRAASNPRVLAQSRAPAVPAP